MNIPAAHASNVDQATYWNGPGGRHWIDRQEMQDGVLAPVAERLLKAAGAAPGDRVVDVGCGCGATTLAVARVTGASGRALGVDISAPMIERARESARRRNPRRRNFSSPTRRSMISPASARTS